MGRQSYNLGSSISSAVCSQDLMRL